MKNKIEIKKAILAGLLIANFISAYADGMKPPTFTGTSQIIQAIVSHYGRYNHLRLIGTCFWWKCSPTTGCSIYPTMELNEYQPDLIVSVYNGVNTNAWNLETQLLDKPAHKLGNALIEPLYHAPLANGQQSNNQQLTLYTKNVDIVGSPAAMLQLPFQLKWDVSPFTPYYQSDIDSVPERSGIAEDLRPETYLPMDAIGENAAVHWGYEFPRSMSVKALSDYEASLMIAQRAADIVTNINALHVVNSTADSCGKNCAVSNVINEQSNKHEIWQEVYPRNRTVKIGETSESLTSLGHTDEKLGNGNYVFVVWRHYRGCVQGKHFIAASVTVPPTQKR